jgi:hypothetical protein
VQQKGRVLSNPAVNGLPKLVVDLFVDEAGNL